MTSFSGAFTIQNALVGVVDVVGVPTDASITATGATPAGGMLARDSSTELVYARDASGTWTSLLPLVAADHGALTGLTDDDHPQYNPFYQFALISGRFYGPAINTSSGAVVTGVGVQRAAPWWLPQSATFDQIVAHSGSAAVASSVIRPAVWADDGTGHPGALVIDGGSDLSANSTDTDLVQTLGTPVTLARGTYWVGGICNGAPNLRTTNLQASPFASAIGSDAFSNFAFAGYTRTPGAGAPSNPFGTPGTASTIPAVRLRKQ